MNLTSDFLKALAAAEDRSAEPLNMIWPMPGNPAGWLSFSNFGEWREFIFGLSLRHPVPEIVAAKFERALKLHLLAWLDFDLIKAGELHALTTLELALTDRYGLKVRDKRGKIYFRRLLRYLPKHDNLTDDKLPMIQRCGGTAIGMLTGDCKPSLADIRNDLAHGYPFNSSPYGGLLELVRDLIDYVYRDWPE
jgi:hypothetical protein